MIDRTITIEQIVSRTGDLPSIPSATLRVIKETESSSSSAESIARQLATDQALTLRVLRLANSPYYGLSRQIKELPEAVVVLGLRTVKSLAIVASTYPWMTQPLPSYRLGPTALWTQSFATAIASQLVARLSESTSEEVAFTAGLLHDMGKVALSVWMDNKIIAILRYAEREGLTFDEAERKVLGYDHTQVGEHLAIRWNLPQDICEVIRYHHQPAQAEKQLPLLDCVHVGNFLATSMGFGLGGDGLRYHFDEKALERLGLKLTDLDAITDAFVTGYEKYETMFMDQAA